MKNFKFYRGGYKEKNLRKNINIVIKMPLFYLAFYRFVQDVIKITDIIIRKLFRSTIKIFFRLMVKIIKSIRRY